jgi:D-alanyl-D-alanine carboxypeptidase
MRNHLRRGGPPVLDPLLTRRSFLAAGAAAGLGLLIAGCGDEGASPSSSTTTTSGGDGALPVLDATTRGTLDRIFEEGFAATGVAGMAGVFRIGDEVWSSSAGVANLGRDAPFDPSHHVRIASITKTFAATAVLQLVDAGDLALDDVIGDYLADIPNGDIATIQDLLAMQSGIPDFTADPDFAAAFDADPTMAWSDEQTLAIVRSSPPDFEPGAKVVYCDSNYALLGMVIGEVTGSSPADVITRRIIEPLKLASTSYPTTDTIPDPHPTGYVPTVTDPDAGFDNIATPPKVVDELNPAVPSTAGAMISTLEDIQTWGTELVRGSLLTPETQAMRLETRKFDGQQVNFGYGLGISNLNEFLGHDGAIFGFSSVVFTRPQTDTQVALVANESTNSTTPTLTVAFQMIQALYPDQVT